MTTQAADLWPQIEAHKGIILKICRGYCRDPGDRDDLQQEILFQLWKAIPRYTPTVLFTTWMYRIALNVAISFYRKAQREKQILVFPEAVPEEPAPATDKEPIRLLHQFIQQQTALDKALLLLYLENRPYTEIAEIIGITATNVGTRLGRLREKLKTYFSNIETTSYDR